MYICESCYEAIKSRGEDLGQVYWGYNDEERPCEWCGEAIPEGDEIYEV